MAEFRIATGTCTVVDDTLHIERPDTRSGRLWMWLRRYTEQHPGRISAYILAVCAFLLLALTVLLVYALGVASTIEFWQGIVQPMALPALVLGVIAVGVGFGGGLLIRRRAQRRAGVDSLTHPERILLDDVSYVISLSSGGVAVLYVVYRESGDEMVAPLPFLLGMKNEVEAAKELFRNRGVPIESGV